MSTEHVPLPGPAAAPGWYIGPTGRVLRWWTGSRWGVDVALIGDDPEPPPEWRRDLPGPGPEDVVTAVLAVVPPTERLTLS